MLKLNLHQLMDERNLSIQDVFESTGISRNTISQLYNGKSKGIQLSTLSKLVNFLQLDSVDELFIDSGDYENIGAEIGLGNDFANGYYSEEDISDIFSLNLDVFDDIDFHNTHFFDLAFTDGEEKKDGTQTLFLYLPLSLGEQSDSKILQFESLFDSFEDYPDPYRMNNEFADLLNHVGRNDLDFLVSNAFSNFIIKYKKCLPKTVEYIGFRTDFGYNKIDQFPVSYLWRSDELLDNKKINSLLDIKYYH
ncbi:helix-turn-helix domain-containing protein [Limosilactobacillus reuteri]|uniref:helix-turn-helix domain-containing protein n=1 Tax=Limosilactobacillus reuteri TaxID=1598 RepID=UPI000A2D15B2|nr:helix-turn-helix transcriptional regulator [Limosilactobacillus reuteri]OTA43264.1 hypothetical protein BHL74_02390 [Limosilactobacillus reuteri]